MKVIRQLIETSDDKAWKQETSLVCPTHVPLRWGCFLRVPGLCWNVTMLLSFRLASPAWLFSLAVSICCPSPSCVYRLRLSSGVCAGVFRRSALQPLFQIFGFMDTDTRLLGDVLQEQLPVRRDCSRENFGWVGCMKEEADDERKCV